MFEKAPGPAVLAAGAMIAAGVLSIAGCNQSPPYDPTEKPPVTAEIEAPPPANDLEVTLAGGEKVHLPNGTKVSAVCFATGGLQVIINSGKYAKSTAVNVPRRDLKNTNDPYGADSQTPPGDPFTGLPSC